MVKSLYQFTGKRKSASTGIQNDVFKSESTEISKILTSKDSHHLNGLTQYLSEVKRSKMEEEYKVWGIFFINRSICRWNWRGLINELNH